MARRQEQRPPRTEKSRLRWDRVGPVCLGEAKTPGGNPAPFIAMAIIIDPAAHSWLSRLDRVTQARELDRFVWKLRHSLEKVIGFTHPEACFAGSEAETATPSSTLDEF
jgi:hypothetical protein